MDLQLRLAQSLIQLAHTRECISSRCLGQICQRFVVHLHVALDALLFVMQESGDDANEACVEPH
jgi:hypothetical protein